MTIRVTRKPAHAYQHGNLREALVNAGLRLLNEGGVAGLSLRAAAELAGVSHAAPYRHFKDKSALIAAVAEQGFRLLTSSMESEAARHPSDSMRDRLFAIGRGYVGFATKHPGYLGVLFGGILAEAHKTPELEAASNAAYGVLRDTIARGIERGELRGGDTDVVSLACWSLVHGLSHLLTNHAIETPKTEAALHQLVDSQLALLSQGISNEGTRKRG